MSVGWRRALWQFRAGNRAATELSEDLEEEIDRLVNRRERLWERDAELLRRWGGDLLANVDRLTTEALRNNRSAKFEAAATRLRKVESDLQLLERLARSVETYEAARDSQQRLLERFQLETFRGMPLLRIVQRLLERTRSLLDEGAFRKAAFVADLCHQLVERLNRRKPGQRAQYLEQLEQLEAKLSEAAEPSSASEGLEVIQRLVDEDYCHLSHRLIEDLEIAQLGWRALADPQSSAGSVGQHTLRSQLREVTDRADTLTTRIDRWLGDQSRHTHS